MLVQENVKNRMLMLKYFEYLGINNRVVIGKKYEYIKSRMHILCVCVCTFFLVESGSVSSLISKVQNLEKFSADHFKFLD